MVATPVEAGARLCGAKRQLTSLPRIYLQGEPPGGGVPLRARQTRSADDRRRQRQRRPADDEGLVRVSGVHLDREGTADAVATTRMHTRRRRDDVGTRQVAQDVLVDEPTAPVHHAPPAALAPLPPGPTDPE